MSTQELHYIVQRSKELLPPEEPMQMGFKKALALFLELELSVRKFNILRTSINSIHKNCVPSITTINNFKKLYIPTKTSVTEISGEFDLQELLDKTTASILNIPNLTNNINDSANLKLICKCYKQKFMNESFTDESIFFIDFSPFRLLHNAKLIWINPRPSSTQFCRPIKFMFKRETAELVQEEERVIHSKINNLKYFSGTYTGKK